METCSCRFTTKNCSVDPSRTFWMTSRKADVHCYQFFRVFYTLGHSSTAELGELVGCVCVCVCVCVCDHASVRAPWYLCCMETEKHQSDVKNIVCTCVCVCVCVWFLLLLG